ncbi:MAG: IS4 family transposase [Chryseolinea sp.]
MNKSIHFTGQPTFAQLIRQIPKDIVAKSAFRNKSDHYSKYFDTWNHLVSMLFCCYGHCHSLREVVSGMRALEGRLHSCGIKRFPARSTFAEANFRRDAKVFEDIYMGLKRHWDRFSPDSRSDQKVYLIDSTTIQLFKEIFKGAGMSKASGKRKGGFKVHTAVHSDEPMPTLIHMSKGAANDKIFLKHLKLPSGSTVIMDRGYRDYRQYDQWTIDKIRWITRMHPYSAFKRLKSFDVDLKQKDGGVKKDIKVRLGAERTEITKVECRLITYKAPNGKYFEFITNDFDSDPLVIAELYKRRWRIELLFKRLKQNMPLKYFLGDNQNAIQIQVWCALIADLLLQIVKSRIKRKWSFSNIVSLVRLHLFNYLDLYSFLENPDKSIIRTRPDDHQLKLSLTG